MSREAIAFVVSFFVLAGSAQAASHQLVQKWETPPELKIPESVLLDAGRQVLYVSNIDGEPWADDGKGSIAKVSLDGKVVEAEWVKGLTAPKGLAMRENRLYVGDLKSVAVIDIERGEIVERLQVPGAERLNDVTVDPHGTVYVSDSGTKKVHVIRDGKASVYLENLEAPNGLLFHDGALYVLDGQGLYRVGSDRKLERVSDGMEKGVDGVEHVAENDFLVSVWSGVVYYVKGDGSHETLLDTRDRKINSADIEYDAQRRIVYVPTFFRNTVAAYELR